MKHCKMVVYHPNHNEEDRKGTVSDPLIVKLFFSGEKDQMRHELKDGQTELDVLDVLSSQGFQLLTAFETETYTSKYTMIYYLGYNAETVDLRGLYVELHKLD